MYPEQNSEISLNLPARCLSAVHGDRRHHRFLVGTCCTQTKTTSSNTTVAASPQSLSTSSSSNQIFLVRYDEELSEIVMDAHFDHYTGEVWSLSACPLDKRLLITCGGGGGIISSVLGNESSTVLWRLPDDVFPRDEDHDEEDTDLLDEYSVGGGRKRVDTLTAALRGAIERGHDSVHSMEEICTLVHPDDHSTTLRGRISDIVWNPEGWDSESKVNLDSSFSHGSGCNMITIGHASNIVTTWSIGTSSALPIQRIDLSSSVNAPVPNTVTPRRLIPTPPKASWDPHNTNTIALTCGPDVMLYDLRSSQKAAGVISPCHSLGVTALDYNPMKPYVLTTSGQEGSIKFWDLRISVSSSSLSTSSSNNVLGIAALTPTDITSFQNFKRQAPPLKIVQGGHSHWISVVQYNKSHDQLLLTGGTVGLVNLWRINSYPLKPILDFGMKSEDTVKAKSNSKTKDDDSASVYTNADRDHIKKEDMENIDNNHDACVDTMELNDSVYSLSWSAADPWVYAALCYDGTVAVRSVPSKEKYKILL